MSLRRTLLALAAPAAMLLVGACATPFKADVSRFQQMPPPQGQAFFIQPTDPRMAGLEFETYAQIVAGRLTAQGYRQASTPREASLVVSLDYGVDNGHEKIVTTPGFGPGFGGGYGPWGYGGFGGGFYGRRFAYGWADPFWYQPLGYPEVNSYTFYVSHLDMKIRRTADGRVLFEGRARARSVDPALPHLVPNLVEAMFVGFPGRSGEQVQITIPPAPKNGAPPPPPTAAPEPVRTGPTA